MQTTEMTWFDYDLLSQLCADAGFLTEQGGVGSFLRQNRTLYIGRIKTTRDIDNIVERHFEEFGEIEKSQSDSRLSVLY